MNHFYQNLQTAFLSAGWLMMGTGIHGWVVKDIYPERYATGSFVVGAVFVALSYVAKKYLQRDSGNK
jgi:hypothetical protein